MLTPAQDKSSTASASIAEGADNESVTPSEMSRTKKLANQTKEYLSDKVPKERREQMIWRLKKMIIEVQGHADCKQLGTTRNRAHSHQIANLPCRPASH